MGRMKVFITGASGLIGSSVARALVAQGHQVLAASRSGAGPVGTTAVRVDFAQVPSTAWWASQLAGVDVVINAAGIFHEAGGQTFEVLHERAPIALFEGAAAAGVGLVIQVSALGSDSGAETAFHRSKFRADEALRRLPVRSIIVQPSLVYAPLGASAALFNLLATLPVAVLPQSSGAVQPIHLDDLTQAIVALVRAQAQGGSADAPAQSTTLAAVGPGPLSLGEYLHALRRALGVHGRAWAVAVPGRWMVRAATLIGRLRPGTVNGDAVRMLLRGNTGNAAPLTALLGRPPREAADFLQPQEARAARALSQADTWAWVMRASLAFVWIWTGLVSLGLYPVEKSLGLLADFGLHGPLAVAALYAGGVIDLALGVLTFAAPARWLPWVWRAQWAMVLTYTVLITVRIPEWWLHPFGPISKNLPLLAGLGLVMALAPKAHNEAKRT